ncbi:MAG TPA: D-aminoacyl-tRNA deacylase [Bacteroidota bacterium]|nr:D-aminoacyl-tRNA deacylase [Bacteroidota bacterium]
MKALIQRVKNASVTIDGSVQSNIGQGILIFLGVGVNDTEKDADYLARRCADLRIFEDNQAKMNLSVRSIHGSVLIVSQFTLFADTAKGNRPSFTDAAPPQSAESLYEYFVSRMKNEIGADNVQTGIFRSMMDVQLINDGPVTIMIESKE